MDPTTNYLKKVATTRRVDTKYTSLSLPQIDTWFVFSRRYPPIETELIIRVGELEVSRTLPIMPSNKAVDAIYGKLEVYEKLKAAQKDYDRLQAPFISRQLSNIYERLPKVFIDRAGTKLANIDAIFKLIPPDTKFFADLGGAPGAWAE